MATRSRGEDSGGSGGGPRRSFRRRPRTCPFCSDPSKVIDYKQTETLKRMVKDSGKIRPRRETGTCARHQRALAKAIKRSRHMALLTFATRRYR